MTADDINAQLNLSPHPEGGWYAETWRADAPDNARASATAIYFLLKSDERSHWHRVDAAEIWLWHGGAPLVLSMAETEAGPARDHLLGSDLMAGHAPQIIVPPHHWQAAQSTGDWTLVSCIVSPGFEFSGFTLAEPGFDIPGTGSTTP